MNAVFYSLALGGSDIAPLQLVQSLKSLRTFDRTLPVLVFLFGAVPAGFVEALDRLGATVRHLGDYGAYVKKRQDAYGSLFALDPKIHRWLVLDEPELQHFGRLLYIDSDTLFLDRPGLLFEAQPVADLCAREEPFCRRSHLGYRPAYLDEQKIDQLRAELGLAPVPPFNTGVCLLSRRMCAAISENLPAYFDHLYRFLSWFHMHPSPASAVANSSTRAVHDPRFRPDVEGALPYPSQNRWIVDQIAMWLALGGAGSLRFADFTPTLVWQGAEFENARPAQRPVLCHYFSSNTTRFFQWLKRLPDEATTQHRRHAIR